MTGIWLATKYRISPLIAALIGSYLFVWGLTSFGIALMVSLEADFHAAEAGMFILAFPLMLTMFLWSFVCNRLAIWCLLFAGGGAMNVAAWLLQATLIK